MPFIRKEKEPETLVSKNYRHTISPTLYDPGFPAQSLEVVLTEIKIYHK
jgi:hypothetical protein